ncbi:MAG: hypothetical protein P1U68_11375 [Verrucomicrobiales bacterium]|nr:hypothetical protein [Verrucomicrobiales bacterium]
MPDDTDLLRLTLDYDILNGDINATVFNVTDNNLVTSKALSGPDAAPGLSNMNLAGFGWTSIPEAGDVTTVGVLSGFSVTAVPEPASIGAPGFGFGLMFVCARRRRKKRQ